MGYLHQAYELLHEKLAAWFETFVTMLPNFMVAVLVIILFFVLALFAKRAIYKGLEKATGNEAINNFLSRLAGIAVFLFGFFIALDIINLDKTFTSLLAGAGILGLAFSLGFQDVVANFVSSIMIASRRPYKSGDLIETGNVYGNVITINMRSTHILTPQGQIAIVPNKVVYQNAFFNYSRVGKRRIDLQARVSYTENLDNVERTAVKAIEKLNSLQPGTEVEFFYRAFAEYAITFEVRYWIKFNRDNDYTKAVSEGIKNIKSDFNEKGISFPFPIRVVDLNKSGMSFDQSPSTTSGSEDKRNLK